MKLYYKIINDEPIYSSCKTIILEKVHNGKSMYTTIMNPTEEEILEAGWTEVIISDEQLLEEAKEAKIKELLEYDSSSEVNNFSINDVDMWLDHELRQQLKTSVEAYQATGAESVTKIFNDTEYTFTPAIWLLMLAALEVYAAEALNTTERHRIAIKALETIADVENYDYTTGYPVKLAF